MRALARWFAWWPLALAFLAAACTTLPREGDVAIEPDRAFALRGRLSAQHGADALTAGFDWSHAPDNDRMALSTPLGTTLAVMTRAADGVAIELADGRRATAATFDALTASAFGIAIPIDGLAYWVRGSPRAGGAYRAERDAQGRTAALDQDGWRLVYTYADAAARRPRLITLAYPDIAMRVVVDAWRDGEP
jgi:outer membrane lipoprotein LolB